MYKKGKEVLFMEADEIKIKEFKQKFEKIENEISSVIVGQKSLIRNVLTAMIAGGNVLLERSEERRVGKEC